MECEFTITEEEATLVLKKGGRSAHFVFDKDGNANVLLDTNGKIPTSLPFTTNKRGDSLVVWLQRGVEFIENKKTKKKAKKKKPSNIDK